MQIIQEYSEKQTLNIFKKSYLRKILFYGQREYFIGIFFYDFCLHRVTASKNRLSWKGPSKIIKSNFWLFTASSPRVTWCAWEDCSNISELCLAWCCFWYWIKRVFLMEYFGKKSNSKFLKYGHFQLFGE